MLIVPTWRLWSRMYRCFCIWGCFFPHKYNLAANFFKVAYFICFYTDCYNLHSITSKEFEIHGLPGLIFAQLHFSPWHTHIFSLKPSKIRDGQTKYLLRAILSFRTLPADRSIPAGSWSARWRCGRGCCWSICWSSFLRQQRFRGCCGDCFYAAE